jgi:hypothetical protein
MNNVKAPNMLHEFLSVTTSIKTSTASTEGEEVDLCEFVSFHFKTTESNFVSHETAPETKGASNRFRLFVHSEKKKSQNWLRIPVKAFLQ